MQSTSTTRTARSSAVPTHRSRSSMGSVQSNALERAIQGESGVVIEDFAQPGRTPEKSFVAYGSGSALPPCRNPRLVRHRISAGSAGVEVRLTKIRASRVIIGFVVIALAIIAAILGHTFLRSPDSTAVRCRERSRRPVTSALAPRSPARQRSVRRASPSTRCLTRSLALSRPVKNATPSSLKYLGC